MKCWMCGVSLRRIKSATRHKPKKVQNLDVDVQRGRGRPRKTWEQVIKEGRHAK